MRTVRYEEMFPHEIVAARREKPVTYLPLGILEWHGEHCTVGLDGIKAQELCIRAAQRGGGVCMPVQFWGETWCHDHYDPKGKLADAMGLPHGYLDDEHMNGCIIDYELLLLHMLYQIKCLGFKVIYIHCGHDPSCLRAVPAMRQFMDENPEVRAYAGMDDDVIRDVFPLAEQEGYVRTVGDDHAGKWETALMKVLRPELVDLSQIPADGTITSIIDPEAGIVCAEDPRCDDLEEYGEKILAKIIEAMNLMCERMLAELVAPQQKKKGT